MIKEYDVKIGDELYSCEFGWGVVVDIEKGELLYPIEIIFDNNSESTYYSLEFKELNSDDMQTLFWDVPVIPKKPLPNLKINTLLEVWNCPVNKRLRYFSHFNKEGFVFCFPDGKTSYTTTDKTEAIKWENYKVVEED